MEIEILLKKLRYRPGLRASILNALSEYEEAFSSRGFSKSLGHSSLNSPFYSSVIRRSLKDTPLRRSAGSRRTAFSGSFT